MPRLYREARSTRSGRAPATSSASTCCARWPRSRTRSRPSSPRSPRPSGADPRLDAASPTCATTCAEPSEIDARPRLVERMALAAAGLAAGPPRRRGGAPTPSAPRASPARPGPRVRHPAAGTDFDPHHRAPHSRGSELVAGRRSRDRPLRQRLLESPPLRGAPIRQAAWLESIGPPTWPNRGLPAPRRAHHSHRSIEPADDRLDEPNGVGERAVVNVLRHVGRPVVVGRLLQPRAGAQRRDS